MAKSNLVDMAENIYQKLQPEKRAGKKNDTSWHSEKVSDANDSFKKADERRKVGGASKAPEMTAKKPTRKAPPRKMTTKR